MSSYHIEAARERFRPTQVRLLFLAEAPPADPRRFFYYERVTTGDALFLELMRQLYREAHDLPTPVLRERKFVYLERFRAYGHFLADARPDPMPPKASPAHKMRLLGESLPNLVSRLQASVLPATRLILISSTVFAVCYHPLRQAGFNVLNTGMIDFPESGRQAHFRRKLGDLLLRHKLVS